MLIVLKRTTSRRSNNTQTLRHSVPRGTRIRGRSPRCARCCAISAATRCTPGRTASSQGVHAYLCLCVPRGASASEASSSACSQAAGSIGDDAELSGAETAMPHARERRGRRKLCSAKFIGMLSAKSAVTLKGPRVVARASRNQPQSQRTDLTQSAREAAMSARPPLVGLSLWKRQSPASVHRTETLRCRFWRTMHLPRSGNEIQLLSEQAISLSTR